jgi:hypothetical protein
MVRLAQFASEMINRLTKEGMEHFVPLVMAGAEIRTLDVVPERKNHTDFIVNWLVGLGLRDRTYVFAVKSGRDEVILGGLEEGEATFMRIQRHNGTLHVSAAARPAWWSL